jgi:hypothetical protein
MRQTLHWSLLALTLALTGLGLAYYKHVQLGFPLQSSLVEEAWTAQARLQMRAGTGPIRVEFQLPQTTPGLGRLRESFISRGYGLAVEESAVDRAAHWTIRRASGQQSLFYQAVFFRDQLSEFTATQPPFPEIPDLQEPYATAMQSIIDDVRRQSADVASFTTELLARINASAPTEEIALFNSNPEYRGHPVRLARLLLAGARIPTEQINGFRLVDTDRRAQPERLLAVHNQRSWIVFEPATGQRGLPERFLIWWVGDRPPVDVEGATLVGLEWSIRKSELGALDLAEQRAAQHDSRIARLSLSTLPVQTQAVYAVLLLVPIGAFVMVLMRNVVGLPSFGTFMPVLIALAFRETGLMAGLVLFSLVIAVGLSIRFYLEKLQLLLVPRLTAVLIVVVILMVLLSLLSHRLGWDVGLSVGLFPMVILAMVIERMSIVWEERGPVDALKESAGSALIAALAFYVMSLDQVQHLVFVFPELLLALLGLTIVMGRYSGYRISELFRFRKLVAKP